MNAIGSRLAATTAALCIVAAGLGAPAGATPNGCLKALKKADKVIAINEDIAVAIDAYLDSVHTSSDANSQQGQAGIDIFLTDLRTATETFESTVGELVAKRDKAYAAYQVAQTVGCK